MVTSAITPRVKKAAAVVSVLSKPRAIIYTGRTAAALKERRRASKGILTVRGCHRIPLGATYTSCAEVDVMPETCSDPRANEGAII